MVRPGPDSASTNGPLALAVFTNTTCLVCSLASSARSRPAAMSGPGMLNLAVPAVVAAVADQRDEHHVVGAGLARRTARSALVTSSRVARPRDLLVALGGRVHQERGCSAPRRAARTPRASALPHLWNVLPCSGSPARPTTMSRKALQHRATRALRSPRAGSPIRRTARPSAPTRMIGMFQSSRSSTRRHAAAAVADVLGEVRARASGV